MKDLTIRSASLADIPQLKRVASDSGLFPAELLPDMIAPFLDGAHDALWLVAQSGDMIIGFSFSRTEEMTDGTWNMLALGVLPDWQRQGAGHALTRAAETHLRKTDARLLIVDTSGAAEFASARAFYLRAGYTEEARIRDFWADGDDKITFRKPL